MLKKLGNLLVMVVLSVAVLGATALWLLQPVQAFEEMRDALVAKDAEGLEARVDFPMLRENLKQQFRDKADTETGAPGSIFDGLKKSLGQKLKESAIDSSITPEGLAKSSELSRVFGGGDGDKLEDYNLSYKGMSEFHVDLHFESGNNATIILSRNGMDWKVTNVLLPMHFL